MKVIVGCLGRARHGKGTTASLLKAWCESKGIPAQVIAFADPLKDFLTMFVGSDRPFRGNDQERNAPLTDFTWADFTPNIQKVALETFKAGPDQHPTGRQLMQVFGTDTIRQNFCNNAWIKMANGRASMFNGVTFVDDMRFTNEAAPRTVKGGIMDSVVKTVRPGVPAIVHASETAVDEVPASYINCILLNDGDIADLSILAYDWAERVLLPLVGKQ